MGHSPVHVFGFSSLSPFFLKKKEKKKITEYGSNNPQENGGGKIEMRPPNSNPRQAAPLTAPAVTPTGNRMSTLRIPLVPYPAPHHRNQPPFLGLRRAC